MKHYFYTLRTSAVAIMMLGLVGCTAETATSSSEQAASSMGVGQGGSQSSEPAASSTTGSVWASSSEQASVSSEAQVEASCVAPEGYELTDIPSVVDWVNAMPKPVSLPCFLKSLPRPLRYNATTSIFSAQPSQGRRNPRVFLLIGDLVLTVVPDEKWDSVFNTETDMREHHWDTDGIRLLELAFEIPTDLPTPQSIKGELKFPITAQLPRNEAYTKIEFDETLSICAVCHESETLVEVMDGQPVYRSEMLRNPRSSEITLGSMLNEYSNCDPEEHEFADFRCDMLDAIYGQGTLRWESFREEIDTIHNN